MVETEMRSQANMIDSMIRDYCKNNGVIIAENGVDR